MKRSTLLFCVLLGAILWNSCSNDFDLTTDWKDIPVVYGIIDANDETHYIRVQKAFLDPETSALVIAQVTDSIYYDNIDVRIRRGNDEFVLERINGDDEGLPRPEGIFANSPNILYKVSAEETNFQGGESVEFILNRGDDLPVVTASTTIIGEAEIKTPNNISPLTFNSVGGTTIQWKPVDEAVIYDLRLIIHYDEFPTDNIGQVESFDLEWIIDKDIVNDEEVRLGPTPPNGIVGDDFYLFMKGNVPVKPDYTRVFKGIDIVITGGSQELNQFIEIVNANTGITSAQEIPTFTNLSEGQGVFASRNQVIVLDKELNTSTRDSLANGRFTQELNFLK